MLDRKSKLAALRKIKKDKEEQRKLDVSFKIAKQKADALKWQKEKLLRQRQAKQALRDGKNGGSSSASQVVQLMAKGGRSDSTKKSKTTDVVSAFGSSKETGKGKTPVLSSKENQSNDNNDSTNDSTNDSKDTATTTKTSKTSKTSETSTEEEELLQASRSVYVEAQPAGYAFPLLSIYAERDHGMRLERMRNPNIMSSEENLLRTLDRLTRNEVNSKGHRNRHNSVAKKRKLKKKKFEKRLYMYGLDHIKPEPKYPDAVGNKEFVFDQKVKQIPKTWVDIHGVTKVKDVEKAEHFLEQLHEEQVKETLRAQEIAKVQANGDHRRQLKLYTLMKGAESQDKMIDLMDDAGMLSMPQLIKHVKKSVALDHVVSSMMRAQRV